MSSCEPFPGYVEFLQYRVRLQNEMTYQSMLAEKSEHSPKTRDTHSDVCDAPRSTD
jgi:hypothetical protein